MRIFKSGATRDSDGGKIDYEAFLSPIVLESFGKYMNKHRFQKDGKVRDGDNWQKLFGEKHYDVCMKSAWRHFHSWWKAHRGYKTEENIEDSMMALMFNVMAYAYKYLHEKK